MSPASRCTSTFRLDIPAYALGALTEFEVRALRHHLCHCTACSAELARLVPVAWALERATPLFEPVPRLKRSIMRAAVGSEILAR